MSEHEPIDSRVHHALLMGLIERGFVQRNEELAAGLGVTTPEVEESLRRLEANHGVVPHPGTTEPWVVHPFSTTPTLFWVQGRERGWWGPCIWCALGIAALVGEAVVIHTRLGGEGEACRIRCGRGGTVTGARVEGQEVDSKSLRAHFPIPVARAWENVHRHCACTLVFRDEEAMTRWCAAHAMPRGEVLTLDKTAELARAWYGGHLSPTWRKLSGAEARGVFESVGLKSAHWEVGGGGRF